MHALDFKLFLFANLHQAGIKFLKPQNPCKEKDKVDEYVAQYLRAREYK